MFRTVEGRSGGDEKTHEETKNETGRVTIKARAKHVRDVEERNDENAEVERTVRIGDVEESDDGATRRVREMATESAREEEG